MPSSRPSSGWASTGWGEHLYFASDYFDWMCAMAEHLITVGKAYVDSLSAEEAALPRHPLSARARTARSQPQRQENLELFSA